MEEMKKRELEPLRRELLSISGIGKETCDSILLYALSKPVFVVDAYTRRIGVRHNLFSSDIRYDEIQRLFESELEQDVQMYNEFHALLVKIGKERCRKKEPLCKNCPINSLLVC